MERYFDYKGTKDDKKCKFVLAKMLKNETLWLTGVKKQRVKEGKKKIASREKLKKLLRRRFVPTNYSQGLYVKLTTLKQGSK